MLVYYEGKEASFFAFTVVSHISRVSFVIENLHCTNTDSDNFVKDFKLKLPDHVKRSSETHSPSFHARRI